MKKALFYSVWQNGKVEGLKARGNVLVSMECEKYKLTSVGLKAMKTGEHTILYKGKMVKVKLKAGIMHHFDGDLNLQ